HTGQSGQIIALVSGRYQLTVTKAPRKKAGEAMVLVRRQANRAFARCERWHADRLPTAERSRLCTVCVSSTVGPSGNSSCTMMDIRLALVDLPELSNPLPAVRLYVPLNACLPPNKPVKIATATPRYR